MIFKSSKLLLVILSFISIALLVALVLEIYSIQTQNEEASELINLANHDAKVRVLSQSIRIIQNDAAEDLAVFNDLVLSNDKLVPLIEKIEGVGQMFGLDTNIVSVEKLEDKKTPGSSVIRMVMETRGAWTPTFSFIRAVESLPYRVMIDELGLSKNDADWRLKIVLSLHSFD